MEINERFYYYGKHADKFSSADENNKLVTVYTNPQTFSNVPISDLEGIFIQEKNLKRNLNLGWYTPRISLDRNKMDEFEKKYLGKFIPFEK